MTHDVIVVGGGPAGASAATALAASGLGVVVVDPLGFGGRLVNIDVVRDGAERDDRTAGWDLAASLGEAAMAAGVTVLAGQAERVRASGTGWCVTVDGTDHQASAVLVATGCRNRPVPGDEDGALDGLGVSYCAVCDAQLFAGRPVAVVGGGNWAWTEVAVLSPVAASVLWVDPTVDATTRSTGPPAGFGSGNVRVLRPADLRAVIVGEDSRVQAVEVVHQPGGREEIVEVAGVFGADATAPGSEPVAGITSCDGDGFVLTDAAFACPDRPGLFAAGDVRRGAHRSVAAAMAEGVAAAAAITEHLRHARHDRR